MINISVGKYSINDKNVEITDSDIEKKASPLFLILN